MAFCCVPLMLSAQVSFTASNDLLEYPTVASGAAIGIADLNGDGLDDLIRLFDTRQLRLEYQQADGSDFIGESVDPNVNGRIWSLCVADLNNNGYNDIFLGVNGRPKIMTYIPAGDSLAASTLSESVFSQGANFADIDNDGHTDLFVCHDIGLSTPYHNDGSGNLTYNIDLMPAYTVTNTDNSGNYGTTWTDYDSDGDLDMYLSRCRLGVSDPQDGRRINQLFSNNGDGTFTDVAGEVGIRPFAQSWSSDFQDYDGDGDLDCFLINHSMHSQLYENIENDTFIDRSQENGIANLTYTFGIQVVSQDFDNDGDLDVVLTSPNGYVYLQNDGDLEFTPIYDLFPTASDVHSVACGDLNNDGFPDLLAGFANGYNSPDDEDIDQLLINNGNDNNWLNARLVGVNSNPNGIGARLELYGDWGVQLREIRSGESYGIMNSMTQHFGIDSNEVIDSLIVRWPSGKVTNIEGPAMNQTLVINEISVTLTDVPLSACEGETIMVGGMAFTTDTTIIDTVEQVDGDLDITVSILSFDPVYNEVQGFIVCPGSEVIMPDGTVFINIQEFFTYDSEFTTTAGCDSIITTNIGVSSLSVDVTFDSTVLMTSLMADAYQWVDCDDDSNPIPGAIEATFQPGRTGNFALQATVEGCTYTSDCQSFVISNIAEASWGSELLLYPNPSKGQVFIQLPALAGSVNAQVYTVLGQHVHTQLLGQSSTEQLNIRLASGVYLLRLVDQDGGQVSRRIVVE